ncbi:MAG TPA: zf-HC2 domain-containing protein, partial [Blastocatellia bacterium]|nr:zf-HC2 domain-containing protein [Blastocatellia bacterium]
MRLSCLYFDRRLIHYLDGRLNRDGVQTIENHLLGCGRCRERLLSLKTGRKLAQLLPRRVPPTNAWTGIDAAIQYQAGARSKLNHGRIALAVRKLVSHPLVSPAGMLLLGAGSMAVLLLLVIQPGRRPNRQAPVSFARFNARDFHQVAINDIQRSDDPHVVAEGYVSDISTDSDDGDLTFRLVEDLRRPGPFVICEIMDSTRLSPPAVGSRVRVYGVSRYDGKSNHKWYEVH